MKRFISALAFAAILGTAGAAHAAGPAGMAPLETAGTGGLVTQIRDRYDRGWQHRGDSSRSFRRHWDRGDWRGRRDYRPHYRPGPNFRLYVEPRVVPRYVQPRPTYRPTYRMSGAHVAWCHARYKSYRAWDNSWQPYNGPRRLCVSPYR